MMNMDDPYANEPRRHPVLMVRAQKPFNAEPPASLLVENFITPTYIIPCIPCILHTLLIYCFFLFCREIFYVRHHLPVPDVNLSNDEYALEVAGADEKKSLSLKLDELKTTYKPHTITAALQCSGNRRSEMNRFKPVKGLAWAQGAMGNAEWKGVRLRDLLLDAGFQDGDDNENWFV